MQRVSIVCLPNTGDEHEMPYGGFERDRQCYKYLYPSDKLGNECKVKSKCPISHQVRIPWPVIAKFLASHARPTNGKTI
jgi:hypothetical protein